MTGQSTVVAAPTVAAIFSDQRSTAVPIPTPLPTPRLPQSSDLNENEARDGSENLQTVPIYTDQLLAGWSIEHDSKLQCGTTNQSFVYTGNSAILCSVIGEDAILRFSVGPEIQGGYPHARVAGLRFFLSSPREIIDFDALAVSMQGSNQQSYWSATDQSVHIEGRDLDAADQPLFSETPLYFLGVNRAIRPGEWVEVTLWLENQIYDPDYAYVTGFYLKTDKSLLSSFAVDKITLLMEE
jgi:hypothetical protein